MSNLGKAGIRFFDSIPTLDLVSGILLGVMLFVTLTVAPEANAVATQSTAAIQLSELTESP